MTNSFTVFKENLRLPLKHFCFPEELRHTFSFIYKMAMEIKMTLMMRRILIMMVVIMMMMIMMIKIVTLMMTNKI